MFGEAFNSGCGGCLRVCACGRVHYDSSHDGGWDWEDGERESLRENPDAIPHCGTVSSMCVCGEEIVYGCTCDKAQRYESFIVNHQHQIVHYLRLRAKNLIDEAESIKI
jgi:hypothetical protein